MAIEKTYPRAPVVAFLDQGTKDGTATVTDTSHLKVKNRVLLYHPTLPSLDLEVKRIISDTKLELGKPGSIQNREDLSQYDGWTRILCKEQSRPAIPDKEIVRATYEEEPTVAVRTVPVDRNGRIQGSIENPSIVSGWDLRILQNVLTMQLLGLSAESYLRTNDNFLVTDNEGNFIEEG